MDPGQGGHGGDLQQAQGAYQNAYALWSQVDTGDIAIPEWWDLGESPSTACMILDLQKKVSVLIQWVSCFETYPAPRTPAQDADLQACVDQAFNTALAEMGGCVVQA